MTPESSTVEAIGRQGFWDPAIFDAELEKIFKTSWLFVAHESELEQKGDYVTRKMGAEAVIVTRDEAGQPRVFLNTCTHRGGQLCRADMGNTSHFRCSYHGWTFSNKGELRGVPELRAVYPAQFDRKAHGLAGARVDTFAGLIFATFNPDAPSLREYLGDLGWYLEAYFGKAPMEVVGAPTRGIVRSNWKVGAENYGGDGYHVGTTHRSAVELGVFGNPEETAKLGPLASGTLVYCVDAGNGHCIRIQKLPIEFEKPTFLGYPPELWGLFASNLSEDQLTANSGLAVAHGNVFPNLSFLEALGPPEPNEPPVGSLHLRQWHPISADRTELAMWSLVPKDAPEEWKRKSHAVTVRTLGFGGVFETDDLQNWVGMAETNRGPISRQQELVYEAVLGDLPLQSPWPGHVYAADHSDVGLLALHRRWNELMRNDKPSALSI
jgi:PAH dioxygenase large subunit